MSRSFKIINQVAARGLIMTSLARISENPRKRANKIKMSRSDQLLGGASVTAAAVPRPPPQRYA